jgi:hypothetical protein
MSNTSNSGRDISDVNSEASIESGLTDWALRRLRGEVPIFGGDPRTGASELRDAAGKSFSYANRYIRKPDNKYIVINPVAGDDQLANAAELDSTKVRQLLETGQVVVSDVSKYLGLILETQRIVTKRESAMRVSAIRSAQEAVSVPALYAYYRSFVLFKTGDDGKPAASNGLKLVRKLEEILEYKFRSPTLALVAITHSSFTMGADSNRVLAHVGDSVLKWRAAIRVYNNSGVVADVDKIVQQYQSNVALRDAGIEVGLAVVARAADGVDTSTKQVMATMVEAVIGAVAMDSEMNPVLCDRIAELFGAVPQSIKVHFEHFGGKEKEWWEVQDRQARAALDRGDVDNVEEMIMRWPDKQAELEACRGYVNDAEAEGAMVSDDYAIA